MFPTKRVNVHTLRRDLRTRTQGEVGRMAREEVADLKEAYDDLQLYFNRTTSGLRCRAKRSKYARPKQSSGSPLSSGASRSTGTEREGEKRECRRPQGSMRRPRTRATRNDEAQRERNKILHAPACNESAFCGPCATVRPLSYCLISSYEHFAYTDKP